jgi:cell division protein FtsI/penicillin-binding protein 2
MLGRTDSRKRLLYVMVAFVLIAAGLEYRLAYWQVVRRDELAAAAVNETVSRFVEPTHRGTIFDRTGTVVLATTVQRDRLAANPNQLSVERRAAVADRLVDVLGLSGDAAETLRTLMASAKPYVVLAPLITVEQSDKIRTLSSGSSPELSGLVLEPVDVRSYPLEGGAPDTSLASQLLGFVNRDGQGQYGVEQYYQSVLAGSPRVVTAERDAAGNPVPDSITVIDQGSPGHDVTLTIDESLQAAVEQELLAAWIADRAKAVSAVVMDPYTGEVYASAGYPGYDANDYSTVATRNPALFVDPVMSKLYEPGSVFKLLTATAAIGNGTVTLDTPVEDSGRLKLDGGKTEVSDADLTPLGVHPFAWGVAFSRNVVAARVALALGKTTAASSTILYDTWKHLGIGAKTGIDVASEATGLVTDPAVRPWREIDLANGSFGQGVAVTPIQLATAYAAMVNGGVLVQPRVVRAIGATDSIPVARWRAMDPSLSQTLVSLMRYVIVTNPLLKATTLIPGYDVGGKTGTAQIWDASIGDWKPDKYNYSFVGFIGRTAAHPDLVISVRIEEATPTVMRQGLILMPVMSFELFRRIAHDAITTSDLLPDAAMTPPIPTAAP